MFSKTLIVGSALAVAASAATTTSAPTAAPSSAIDPACSSIESSLTYFPTQAASASSFCSSYFRITTSTTTTTRTTTTSPTTTVYTATSTCVASPRGANAKREPQFTTSTTSYPGQASMSAAISSACSCIGVNFSPSATATRTATVTASTSTVSTASTQTVAPQATYVAPGGTRFGQYYNTDFYGGDLVSSYCGPNGQFQVSSTVSTPCTNFTSCENSCEAYNRANPGNQCVGASYSRSNTFCYLKSSVSCNVQTNFNVDSGLIMQ